MCMWTYMNYGPWSNVDEYRLFLKMAMMKQSEYFYAIISNSSGKAVGY